MVKLTGRARLATAAAAALVMLAGCGSDDNLGGTFATDLAALPADCTGKNTLTAEGSTAQQNAIALFNRTWGRLCPGKNISYNPTGSGAGREQFVAGQVDFAGSDSPLATAQAQAAAQRCHGSPAWHLPLVFGPVALAYNLDGYLDDTTPAVVVSGDVLAGIFSGAITSWTDPALTALNPGVTLPELAITPIYRSDSSGTTDNFQKYLAAAAPTAWTKGVGTEFHGGAGEGSQKSAGVVQAVQATPGAIGYVEQGFADQALLPYAAIDNGSGAVPLTADAAGRAIDAATFEGDGNDLTLNLHSLFGTQAPGAYPLVLTTYEIVCSQGYDPQTSAGVKSFLIAAATHGQGDLAPAGYIALPERFTERLVTAIEAIQ